MKNGNSKDRNSTKGIVLVVLSVLAAIFLLGFFDISAPVINFFVGVFGFSVYAMNLCSFLIGITLLLGYKITAKPIKVVRFVLLYLVVVATLQIISSAEYWAANPSFSEYIAECYNEATTAGGVIFGILVYYPVTVMTYTAALVIFIAVFILLACTTIAGEINHFPREKRDNFVTPPRRVSTNSYDYGSSRDKDSGDKSDERELSKDLYIAPTSISKLSEEENETVIPKGFPLERQGLERGGFEEGITKPTRDFSAYYKQNTIESVTESERAQKPAEIINDDEKSRQKLKYPLVYDDDERTRDFYTTNYMASKIQRAAGNNYDAQKIREDAKLDSWMSASREKPIEEEKNKYYGGENSVGKVSPKSTTEYYTPEKRPEISNNYERKAVDAFSIADEPQVINTEVDSTPHLFAEKPNLIKKEESQRFTSPLNNSVQSKAEQKTAEYGVSAAPRPVVHKPYKHPPVTLLRDYPAPSHKEDTAGKSILLENVLSSFGINAKVVNYVEGPAFVMYEMQIPTGVSVKKIAQYDLDLQSSLELTNKVGILAPIPGKNAVGIELPKDDPATVGLKELFESGDFFKNPKLSPIAFCLGKDISNRVYYCDIKTAPHILIAGATNSGKSVSIHILLASILFRASPDEVKLILVDPKRVELNVYSGLPHLLLKDIIADAEHTLKALDWCIEEMERRYLLFQEADSRRNIAEFNDYVEKTGKFEKIPYIVFIIDELADLMSNLANKKALENRIVRLAQKARASGIHLVFATQRPSTDVVTGVIKSNLPTRIVFSVSSYVDSNVALSQAGAEKLLGRGDMYYKPVDRPSPLRLQGAFISNDEVLDIVNFIKEKNEAYFDENVENAIFYVPPEESEIDDEREDESINGFDPLLVKALYLFVTKRDKAGATAIQTRFNVGYARAKRIINEMEDAKFISQQNGTNKARDVLITEQEFYSQFGDPNENNG